MEVLIMLNGVDTVISKQSSLQIHMQTICFFGKSLHHIILNDLEQIAAWAEK